VGGRADGESSEKKNGSVAKKPGGDGRVRRDDVMVQEMPESPLTRSMNPLETARHMRSKVLRENVRSFPNRGIEGSVNPQVRWKKLLKRAEGPQTG